MSETFNEWTGDFEALIDLIGDDELYENVRSMLSHSRSTIALNRKVMEKTIEVSWVEAIEKGLGYVDNVLRNPRKTIVNVEEVVPVALSKKITVDSIKHLAQHTDLIQSVDPVTGKITPSKVLNVHKEESLLTYENKFVNTLIDRLYIFVTKRYEKLKAASANEEVYALEYNTSMGSDSGSRVKMSLKIETVDSLEKTDENGSTMWDRVEKIRRIIESYKASPFCQQMGNNYIRPPVMRTNAIMKNVDLKACLVLWQFIEGYDKVGYEINVSDAAQKPEQTYIENLYSVTALNYLLFRAFTHTEGRNAEILKTRSSKAAAPRILRRLENADTTDYDIDESSPKRAADNSKNIFAQALPQDSEEILKAIDDAIRIETHYFRDEEQRRIEAEERELIRQEEERRRQEEEQRRLEEERRIEEEKRLAREQAEREEQERLEKERQEAERLEKERLQREEQERLEKERIEKERAEAEEKERIAAERAELSRMIGEEREKHETERAIERAEAERLQREREEREAIRAQKLKEMRTELERKSFDEIYREYSKNPIHIAKRAIRRLISLIRKDGKVIREGDSDNPMLVERIAAEAAAKKQAEIDRKKAAEMQVLYEKYSPTFFQRLKKRLKRIFGKKKKKVYVMPKQMPPKRTAREQRKHDKEIHELFRKYHVSFITKIIRLIKKEN